MKALDWLKALSKQFLNWIGIGTGISNQANPLSGGYGEGPPDNAAPVPRRPIGPQRTASAAEPIPDPEREYCEK